MDNNLEYSKDGRLAFDKETHTYWLDGIKIPSVTSLISCEYPSTYAYVDENVLERARERGTELHRIIELYERLDGYKDTESEMYPRLEEYIRMKELFGFTVDEPEVMVYYEDGLYKYAGTIDTIGTLQNMVMLSDTKSYNKSISMKKDSEDYIKLVLQLTGYALAYEQMTGREVKLLRLLHLPKSKGKFLPIERNDTLFLEKLKEHYHTMIQNLS